MKRTLATLAAAGSLSLTLAPPSLADESKPTLPGSSKPDFLIAIEQADDNGEDPMEDPATAHRLLSDAIAERLPQQLPAEVIRAIADSFANIPFLLGNAVEGAHRALQAIAPFPIPGPPTK